MSINISKQKDSEDKSTYDINQIVDSFSNLLEYVVTKQLSERKQDNTLSEKTHL